MRESVCGLHIAYTEPGFLDHTGFAYSWLESLSTVQVVGLSTYLDDLGVVARQRSAQLIVNKTRCQIRLSSGSELNVLNT
jgi:hypothetical protein